MHYYYYYTFKIGLQFGLKLPDFMTGSLTFKHNSIEVHLPTEAARSKPGNPTSNQ